MTNRNDTERDVILIGFSSKKDCDEGMMESTVAQVENKECSIEVNEIDVLVKESSLEEEESEKQTI